MDADHHQVIGEFFLQPLECGDNVDAVDATEGPEIQNSNFAQKVGNVQRARGVEPGQVARIQRGCANQAFIHKPPVWRKPPLAGCLPTTPRVFW